MESGVHASVPLRVGKKMRKRRELDALVGGGGARGGRLLSASSDEGEPWARRTSRRRRSRPFLRLAAALALCVCVVSAATVLWLFVDVRRQIVSLRIEMDRVSTGSDSVGDALQRCHTATKELKTNTTDLSTRLARLELEYVELTKRVEKAVGDLGTVQAQLSAAPELRDIPKSLGDLQKTVGELGSQINGFDGAINSAKKQALTAATSVDEVKTLLHQLEGRTNDTIVNVTAGAKRQEELAQQLSAVNATLQASVDQLNVRIQEINKPTSTAAPTTSSTSTTTTAPPPAPTINTPPPPPPGPPAKPNVLQ